MGHSTSIEEVKKHVKTYYMVFGALMVLTVVTVAIAYLHLSIIPALILALFVASIKGALVACYFMHLISEKTWIYITLGITMLFFVCMIGIFIFAYYGQEGVHVVP